MTPLKFENLEGSVKESSQRFEDEKGSYTLVYFTATYHPAKEIFYRDEKVIFQVCERSDTSHAFILVPGYRKSKTYPSETGLSVYVEPIHDKTERKEIRGLLKKIVNPDYHVMFW